MPDGCELIRQAPLIAAPVRLFMTMESSHSVLSIVYGRRTCLSSFQKSTSVP